MKMAALKILILGGSHFLGIHLTEELTSHGHEVTLFNRGTHTVQFNVEQIRGDREGNLDAFAGRHWDAVIDTSGHLPRVVEQSAKMLSNKTDHYTFISTIGVYRDFEKLNIDEQYPLATLKDPTSEVITEKTYGALKALCEAKVQQYFPDRSLIVRSGLLVGPHDPTDRFTYWIRRSAFGGKILAPANQETQFIDARDLAKWIVSMIERQSKGVYNATGPSYRLEYVLQEGQLLSCSRDPIFWVSDEFLKEQGVQDWIELPLWLSNRRNMPGFLKINSEKAAQSGLQIRPLKETITSVFEWDKMRKGSKMQAGLDPQKEKDLLDKWQKTQS